MAKRPGPAGRPGGTAKGGRGAASGPGKSRPRFEAPASDWRPEKAERAPRPADREAEARPRAEHRRPDDRAGSHSRRPRPPTGEALIKRTGLPLLYGVHSVAAALANPARKVRALYLTEGAAERLAEALGPDAPEPTIVRGEDIDRLLGADVVHQGAVAEVHALPEWDLLDIPDDGVVLVLDQITDPHNVGAILRSAAAFNVSALVMTERHSPDATGVLAKTASGGLEHVPIVTVGNLAQALSALGERGFWRIGLDSDGPVPLDAAVATRPLCLVLGAEGKGLRRLTRERCDVLARLDVPGAIRSLNVSNAAAVALYAIDRALAARPTDGGGSTP